MPGQGMGTESPFPGPGFLVCWALGSDVAVSLCVAGPGLGAHGGPGKPQRDGCAGGRPCQSPLGSQPRWPRQAGGRPAEMQFYNQPIIWLSQKINEQSLLLLPTDPPARTGAELSLACLAVHVLLLVQRSLPFNVNICF